MQPFRYYKLKAKEQLYKRLSKPALIAVFTILFPVILDFFTGTTYKEGKEFIYYITSLITTVFILQPFTMGATLFYMRFTREEDASVGIIFDGFSYFKRLIPYLVITALITIGFTCVSEWLIALLETPSDSFATVERVSIIYFVMGAVMYIINKYLSFTFYILYDYKEISGFKAVIKSIKMTKDYILYLIRLEFSFILWIISIPLTLGVTLFYTVPYMNITLLMAYEDIKEKENMEEIEETYGGNE